MSYYRVIQAASILKDLDSWIRRKLRKCRLKQWKKPKTRVRELMKLGIGEYEARCIASSGKGNWRLSMTLAVQKAMGNMYWKRLGLLSLEEMHKRLC